MVQSELGLADRSELLSLLDIRSKQVERLIATVKKDRSDMAQIKTRVATLMHAVTHFARRGACLSLKSIRRANASRKLARSFECWHRATGSTVSAAAAPVSPQQSLVPAQIGTGRRSGEVKEPAFAETPGNLSDVPSSTSSTVHVAALVPSLWQQVEEEHTGDTYWWNRATNEVTWDTPAEVRAAFEHDLLPEVAVEEAHYEALKKVHRIEPGIVSTLASSTDSGGRDSDKGMDSTGVVEVLAGGAFVDGEGALAVEAPAHGSQENLLRSAQLAEAATKAKAMALAKLEASKESAVAAAAATEMETRFEVPAIAERIVARHGAALCAIIMDCEASSDKCEEGLKAWKQVRSAILAENADCDVIRQAEQESQSRFILAAHLVVEVLDAELHRLQERFLVKQALPVVNGACLVGLLSVSGLAVHARDSAECGAAAVLAAHVATLVRNYCNPSRDTDVGAKKKRPKKGGGVNPRPVNHPVLSSPLVLKSSPDFHPSNAKVLGVIGSAARLADGFVCRLVDELIVEMQRSSPTACRADTDGNASDSVSSPEASHETIDRRRQNNDGLTELWRQAIIDEADPPVFFHEDGDVTEP